MARPTKSTILYTQCVGRGTRKYPGKEDCIVIDFCDNRHDICSLPQLLGFNVNKLTKGESAQEEIERQDRQLKIGGDGYSYNPPIGEVLIKEFDLLGKSVFRWFHDGEKWRLPIAPGVHAILIPSDDKYKVFIYHRTEENQLLHPSSLDLGYGQGIAEDYARQYGKHFSRKDSPWREKPATDKQIDLLRRLGIDLKGMTKGLACDAIDEFFAKKEVKRQKVNY